MNHFAILWSISIALATVSSMSAQELRLRKTLSEHTGCVECVAFSPNGKTLVSGGLDGTLRFWNVATWKNTATFRPGDAICISFRPGGKAIALGTVAAGWMYGQNEPTFNTVTVLDAVTGKAIATVNRNEFRERNPCVAFSPDGKTLAYGHGGEIRLWDTASRKTTVASVAKVRRVAMPPGYRPGIDSVAFSPDGRTLAAGGSRGWIGLWDVVTRKNTVTLAEDFNDIGQVVCLAFRPDSKVLASAGYLDKKIKLWDLATKKNIVTLHWDHGLCVESIAFSPDGRTLVGAGSGDKQIRLWNVATRKIVAAVNHGRGFGVSSVAFGPDGKILASAGDDKTIKIWEVKPAKEANR